MEKYTNVDKLLIINQKILLDVKSVEKAAVYDSRIEDAGSKSFFITMPSERGAFLPVEKGTEVGISYINDNGRYSFDSKVISKVRDKIPMLELEKPVAIFKKELREFFRVNTRAKIKVLVSRADDRGNNIDDILDAAVQDISGGGMRISMSDKIELGCHVEIYFGDMVPDLKTVKALVTRSIALDDGRYEAGIQFLNINAVDRDRVIKYVFKRQLELRKLIG